MYQYLIHATQRYHGPLYACSSYCKVITHALSYDDGDRSDEIDSLLTNKTKYKIH